MDSVPPLSPPPPMSTSSLPPEVAPISVAPMPIIKPPVLASDILREEVAPIAPAQRAVRIWLVGFALAFAALAVAWTLGFGPTSRNVFHGSIATAIVALLAALLSAPYAARASFAVVAGLVPLALGAMGEGPLAAIAFQGHLAGALGLSLVTLLPGALFFRARYRAFRAARIILAGLLLLSLPAMVGLARGAIADGDVVLRLADGGALLASLTAFFGFMGEETTGGCANWALLIILAHAARLGLQTFGKASGVYGLWGFVIGAAGEFAAAALVASALFQLLAVAFAREARKVDVHRIVGPGAEDRPPLTSMTSE